MPGLFDTLNLGSRSLQAHQFGLSVTGHNIANVNNPAYARQRAVLQTGIINQTQVGPVGSGVDAIGVKQIRDAIYDRQIEAETSISSYLESQKRFLDLLQASFGERINDQSNTTDNSLSTSGLAYKLQSFFDSFQKLSLNPASLEDRVILINSAIELTTQFNQIASEINRLNNIINDSINADVSKFNNILGDIAQISKQIEDYEFHEGFRANDLRDLRQQKLEELSQYVKIDVSESSDGKLNISVNGIILLSENELLNNLETYDSGNGKFLVRAAGSSQPLNLISGSIQGAIDARDQILLTAQTNLDEIARALIAEVNQLHKSGFDLNGNTGQDFFAGTDASTIKVNELISSDPSKIQLSSVAGETTNNQIAISIAQLRSKNISSLNNLSINSNYAKLVEYVGSAVSNVNNKIENQNLIKELILQKRSAISGVSIDEEMSELIKYQKAYEASAKLIATVDELLDAVLAMKR